MDDIFINYRSISYTPTTTTIYYSNDGLTWTNAGDMSAGDMPTLHINANLKYLRIKMSGNPPLNLPIVREVDWLPVQGSLTSTGGLGFGPSIDPTWYFPSNAFDGNTATWWVGKPGAGPWDLYYHWTSTNQIIINTVAVNYYSSGHKPTTSVLKYSNDGATWTTAGTMAGSATETLTVARKASYINVNMTGDPPLGNQLRVREISVNTPIGPSGGISNAVFPPSRAFDGNMATYWAGHTGDGVWYLFYGYAATHHYGTATVTYVNANYTPTTTNIYMSENGWDWGFWGTMPAGTTTSLLVNRTHRYICFEMSGSPPGNYPAVKEITY
jgi:hypothetical protein